ncbi:capsule assembly Wzi family protein [Sediminibacterium sp.]|uniref:capsule assembly Wzi family protein n=1 Tax=Sediminibacterium sp. TaxID=1917865 RepID=UPI003F709BA4
MRYLLILFFISLQSIAPAQLWQLDMGIQEQKRLEALLNNDSLTYQSYAIRFAKNNWSKISNEQVTKKPQIQWLFAGYGIQHNNNLPISFNDGNFLPNVGLQHKASIGAQFNWGLISIHLQPELVQGQNLNSSPFVDDVNDVNYRRNFYWYVRNKVDNGTRIGTQPFKKLYWGQSSVRLNSKNFSFGLSTENLWWGPGIRNSLLLTNNAPGFMHLTLNSIKPIQTKLGNFEFQVILGNLDSAIAPAIDFNNLTANSTFIEPKSINQRGIAGYYISWKPKWFKHLYLGLGGMTYFYKNKPAIQLSANILDSENKQGSASLSSVFFRYAIPSENAEVYLEYGRNGKFFAPFHILGDTIPTSYLIGFSKLFKLRQKKISKDQAAIMLGVELTQLQLPDNRLIFNAADVRGIPRTNSWYTHPYIKQGYTQQGQILGASIGPGSNSQTLNLSWVKGMKKIGLTIERINYNADFYQFNFFRGLIGRGEPRYYWIDINASFQVQWDFKKVLFNATYMYTSSLNYRWTKLDGSFAGPSTLSDKRNNQLNFSIYFFFKK